MNTHLPNLKHLQYLLALNEHRHFHKAADACFVSQSTLSSAIIKLEQLLDCQIIEREHKSFVFTTHGKAVVAMAEKLVAQASEFVEFSMSQGKVDKGLVHIGCIPTIAPFLLTDVVSSVQQQLPDIELLITEAPTDALLTKLQSGDIDVAILAMPINDKFSDTFHISELGSDNFYVSGEPSLVDSIIKDQHYRHIPDGSIYLLSDEHCMTAHAISACKLVDKSKVNAFAPTSLTTLMQMTIHHKGVTFLPEMAIRKGIADISNVKSALLPDQPSRAIALLERQHSPRTQTFSLLAKLFKQQLKKS
ncbi:LysR substrate-binding domain-containing protein [Thalassotalea maritima]|uniref:hydrogen peroxide-inducible genes activator n=1 Tax=Thalassotalea maritima TaxID=3242416 RepID=UPI0035285F53